MSAQDSVDSVEDFQDSVKQNTDRIHSMEQRIQTVAMVLIVGFLTWVGTGLVDVKVGLAQVLSESVSLRGSLDSQGRRLVEIEKDIQEINKEMASYITRDEFREELKALRESNNSG